MADYPHNEALPQDHKKAARAKSGTPGSRNNHNAGVRKSLQERRQDEAKARNETWAKMTPAEQLQALDGRLGKSVGAVKQRARLQAAIAKATLEVKPEAKKKGK
jgi:hypothetical protein